ncbi:uncharacterized protein LOC122644742 [Telopea speciosissima]|uniref:uncharacterized protein LOC122644742 n=1 Tax=Telopea speciosissima TaxID=54955 RepID=UPI001CC5AE03|nr:uncharacterized protein LOC122644742 [Telopea speciosissima]
MWLHVPEIRRNLISGPLLNKAGMKLLFESDKLVVLKNDVFVGKGYLSDGLFVLSVSEIIKEKPSAYSAYFIDYYDLWHGRLGHCNASYISYMHKKGLIDNHIKQPLTKCPTCVEAKFTKRPHRLMERQSGLLDLVLSDLCDYKSLESRGGKKYVVTFIDDHSRFTMVYLLKSKDEASNAFISYKAEVKNQLGRKVKRLRTDRGTEYSNLSQFCEDHAHSTAYRFMVIKTIDDVFDENDIIESRDAEFFENVFPLKSNLLERKVDSSVSSFGQEVSKNIEPISSDSSQLRKSKRQKKATFLDGDWVVYLLDNDPLSYKEAVTSLDAVFWKEAIKSELDSILANHTWILVDFPKAFLNGDLVEEIYIKQPEGYVVPGQEHKVLVYAELRALKAEHYRAVAAPSGAAGGGAAAAATAAPVVEEKKEESNDDMDLVINLRIPLLPAPQKRARTLQR